MKTIVWIITLLLLFTFLSCIDILEKDLSNVKVELLSPADAMVTKNPKNRFWWNSIDGALWYELQVVNPDFANISSLKLDTVFAVNNFQLSLQPGVYHWRVRAFNGSSSTEFSTSSLTIESSN